MLPQASGVVTVGKRQIASKSLPATPVEADHNRLLGRGGEGRGGLGSTSLVSQYCGRFLAFYNYFSVSLSFSALQPTLAFIVFTTIKNKCSSLYNLGNMV